MITETTKSKLKKHSSLVNFKKIQNHPLNKSPTKNVPSLHTRSQRFLQPSFSPNKFYDIPDSKSQKSVSFGYGQKTNFAKKQFIGPARYRINSSFDLKNHRKNSGPSFGISRETFYKGMINKNNQKIGPGIYNLQKMKKKNSFYMGLKISRKDSTIAPGPGTYNLDKITTIQNLKRSIQLKIKGPRIKTQYFQKAPLSRFDNKVPGPGSYDLDSSRASMVSNLSANRPKLPQCPRFKVRKQQIPPPGRYQTFSQFGE